MSFDELYFRGAESQRLINNIVQSLTYQEKGHFIIVAKKTKQCSL